MTRSAIVPAILALSIAGSAAALDYEPVHAPYLVGGPATPTADYFVGVDGTLKSKLTDDYRVVANDTVLGVDGQFRAYGFGLAIETDWAVGQAEDISRPGDKVNPGEFLRTEVRVDYAIEFRDPSNAAVPMLQLIPHFEYITYPNQKPIYGPSNEAYLKYRQRWLGVDAWYALPNAEGVEVGGGVEYNLSSEWRATRGGLGARELWQHNNVDMVFWQLFNLADSEYRRVIGGDDTSGATTAVAGGRATVPMYAQNLYGFVQIEMSYWLDKDIRESNKAAGADSGDVVLSFGLNWIP